MSARITRRPEWGRCGPIWWHHHGMKIKVCREADLWTLNLESSAVSVRISPYGPYWKVEWRIVFSVLSEVIGNVKMSPQNLKCAFGLSDEEDLSMYHEGYRTWLIDRFGGDCAVQGLFIRYDDYLNIPGPGTGLDGDPNVSIMLTDEIRNAVRQLLGE